MDKKYGSLDGVDAFKRAEETVNNFNSQCQKQTGAEHTFAKIEQTPAGETVVAIVDPFMRRVHEVIPQSGEICMVDATSNLGKGFCFRILHMNFLASVLFFSLPPEGDTVGTTVPIIQLVSHGSRS